MVSHMTIRYALDAAFGGATVLCAGLGESVDLRVAASDLPHLGPSWMPKSR